MVKLSGPHPVVREAKMAAAKITLLLTGKKQNHRQLFTYKYEGLKVSARLSFLLNSTI
jgi:hypothetical protein